MKYKVRLTEGGDPPDVEADVVNVLPGLVVFLRVPKVEAPGHQDAEIVYAASPMKILDITEVK